MADITYTKGSNSIIRKAVVKDAFVQNDSVEVEIQQPAGSILTKAYVKCAAQPTVTASMDLGFKIGTTTDGNEVVEDADGIIDGAGNTTAFKTGALVKCGITQVDSPGTDTARAANAEYTDEERTLFCNTTASDSAVSAAGTVEWILFFEILGVPNV
jgi:hypothetical protein